MAISAEKIAEVRDRVDILQVVGAAVSLKKRGARWLGLCPFHNEKSPSFSVSEDKGLYYCFGCHAGGDVFSFVMRHEGLEFHEAVRRLAEQAGVEIDPEPDRVRQRRRDEEELARINAYALAFFEHVLWAEGGARARAYLGERKIAPELAKAWRLGFGGASGELVRYLEAKRVPLELAGRAGLLTDDGRRSLFDNRLMFPIFDVRDRPAGFGGRKLFGDGPKYVNSRESALFSKRQLLFGLERARDTIRRKERVIVVEGFMDVLACHRAGLSETVAALGTAFTDEHARTCARFAKEAIVMFDGDEAGARASREVTERILAAKLKALVAPLPPGEDPDSLFSSSGSDGLEKIIAASAPAVEHFIQTAFQPNMPIEDKARAAESLGPLIAALGTGLERDLYTARLAEQVGVPVEQLKIHLQRAVRAERPRTRSQPQARPSSAGSGAASPAAASPATPSGPRGPQPFELTMLAELLLYPELRRRLCELAEYGSDPMRLLLDELATSEEDAPGILARHIPDRRWVDKLSRIEPAAPSNEMDADPAQRTLEDVLLKYKERHLDAMHKDALRELQEAEARGEDPEELIRRVQNLNRRKRELKPPRSNAQ